MRQVQMGNALKNDEWIDIEDEVSDPGSEIDLEQFENSIING